MKKSVFKEAKKVPIVDVAIGCGLQVTNNDMACCPFHDDRNPSMKLYSDSNRFKCFSCGAKGDTTDFVSRLKGLPLLDAALYVLAILSGSGGAPQRASRETHSIRHDISDSQRREIYRFIYDHTHFTPEGVTYLINKRCLSEKTLGDFLPDTHSLDSGTPLQIKEGTDPRGNILDALLQQFQRDDLKASGVLNRKSNLIFTGSSILFFHRDWINGDISYISTRNLWEKVSKSTKLRGVPFVSWSSWSHRDRCPRNIYITESIVDAASFAQIFDLDPEADAAMSYCGIPSQKNLEDLKSRYPESRISVALDNDPAGRGALEKLSDVTVVDLKQVLTSMGAPENLKDYNDLLKHITLANKDGGGDE